MEIKKFNNFILENKEKISEEPKKGRCKDCGKKFKKCKCEKITETSLNESSAKQKAARAKFLEMIQKKKGKKEEKEGKDIKKCKKSEK